MIMLIIIMHKSISNIIRHMTMPNENELVQIS